jgi:Yip1 domain
MTLDTPEPPKANGLKTALDIIVAPKEALENLRAAPTWGWALAITLVFFAVGSYLVTPAILQGTQADWPRVVAANPQLAALTPQQQEKNLNIILAVVKYNWVIGVIVLPIGMLVQTVILYLGKIFGKGDGTFGELWAAVVNIAVPAMGVSALVLAAIVLLRGAASFNSAAEVSSAMPSLALLVPPAQLKLHAFLAVFNPFVLWGFGLNVAAMTVVARVSRAWAWTTALVPLLLFAGLAAWGAR